MKKGHSVWIAGLLTLFLSACSSGSALSAPETAAPSVSETQSSTVQNTEMQNSGTEEEPAMEGNVFYVAAGNAVFTAVFADNSGARALEEMMENGPVTIEMRDYGGFEKVGSLGRELPASDVQTTTQAGDIVLYQGDQIVMFYGSNSWSYTRLGKIDDLTGWEDALGSGNISVTFSLTEPQK